MSTELINRITVKKDGVYLSSHSSNDTEPFTLGGVRAFRKSTPPRDRQDLTEKSYAV